MNQTVYAAPIFRSPHGIRQRWMLAFFSRLALLFVLLGSVGVAQAQRRMEKLNRSVVAIRTSPNEVYVGWRLFGTDPATIAFNVYRGTTKINATPITGATNITDDTDANGTYIVRSVLNGVEQSASAAASVWQQLYQRIPIQQPAGGTTPTEWLTPIRPTTVA
ncbi:hypothetical protein [Hymenobacter volaticus]|uniref:rhamnogalacturonan endolyase family protein n=1 Tax=Hymenobacter volaticus TaxID=2932254 RepID=UPI0024683EEE|nr:hypothetical protein [Hymenobacter volaticus]